MPMEKILVLEDDALVRKSLEQLLRHRRYDVAGVATISAAQECLAQDNFDLVLCDVRLPDGDGTEFLRQLQSRPGKPLVVMMTGFGSVESAVACMKAGAFDYLLKPFSGEQLEVTLQKAQEFTRLLKVNRFFSRADVADEPELLGQSPALAQVRELIRKVARTQATVLIHGESGTGKELVARAIHQASPRAQGPFIRVNCAAIPESLIESEFFGHEKGAFTGAVGVKHGLFETANGGTLFLDEIGELGQALQVKLLRVMQDQEIRRVGGTSSVKVDVRLIAATNRDLPTLVKEGRFREDLFYRLNVVRIKLPPLRERREDLAMLAHHFLQKYTGTADHPVRGFARETLALLDQYSWPGNVRELENAIERAVSLSHGPVVLPEDLPESLRRTALAPPSVHQAAPVLEKDDRSEFLLTLEEVERRHLLRVLKEMKGNKVKTAKILGIDRRTLYRMAERFGIDLGEDTEGTGENPTKA